MSQTTDYLLGHHDTEWARLARQHRLWRRGLLDVIGEPGRVVEVGCGTGELLAELGPQAVGIERDADAAREASSRGLAVRHVDLFDARFSDLDTVVARWVFSFLPDPARAVAHLASWLAPGGRLIIQDYDHDGLAVWPRHDPIQVVIDAFRAAYAARGGDLWVAPKMSSVMVSEGLTTAAHPEVMSGGPDSELWRWVEDFLRQHIGTVQQDGHLSAEEVQAFHQAWQDARSHPGVLLVSPIQLTVVGRRTG